MAAGPQRPDGWVVTYVVDVVFDTDASRTGYDHVGTVVRCTGCGEGLDGNSPAALTRHARRHEPPAHSYDRRHAFASLHREEVATKHTTA